MIELELINYTWEVIKSGIVYDTISFLPKKLFDNLVKAQKDNDFKKFENTLEAVFITNEEIKKELEKYISENRDKYINKSNTKLKAENNSTAIENINNSTVNININSNNKNKENP